MIRNIIQKAEQEFPLVGSGGIPDAPSNGDLYARKDGAWAEAASATDIPIVPSFFYDGTDITFLLGDIPNSYADYGTLTQVYLGNSVTSIGSTAFRYNDLTSVTIPNSVTTIDVQAFYDNDLTSVTIPNSVTSIGGYAFANNPLTSVTIPNSVTSIGYGTFLNCTGLTSISVGSANTTYSSIGGVVFNKTATTLLIYPNGKQASYAIPNSVTSIGDYAFNRCTGLTSVNIGNSVTSIGNGAFLDCTGLTSVNIPDSVTSIGGYAFSGCTGLTSVNIPNSVTSIGYGTFSGCAGLTSVNIPNSVTSIGSYAFRYNSLTSVTISNSVTSIGSYAFGNNINLSTVNCYTPATAFTGSNAFYYTAVLTINVPTSGAVADTWTAGEQSFQGTTVNVVKNL